MSFSLAELYRRFENLIRIGTIAEVDEQAQRLRVQSGELLTDWLPWPAHIGNNFIHWRPLRLNTQVILACPSGDPAQAMVISMLYSDQLPAPSDDAAVDVIQFDDGTTIEYNSQQKNLILNSAGSIQFIAADTIALQAGQSITSTAPQHTIDGDLTIQGAVTQTGGDMTSDGISAQQHKHPGVAAGSAKTGAPQ